jgi:lysophospholipase L1-like esterase
LKRIILPLEPRLLIIYAGENDIAEGQTPASVQIIFHQFISRIRQFHPSLPIAFISIKPSPSRFNQIVQMNITNNLIREDIKSMNNVHYIDIFNEMLTADGIPRAELFLSDNLHMNDKGYSIWTRAVQEYLHTNGFISKGLIHSEISFVILAMNLFIVYLFI